MAAIKFIVRFPDEDSPQTIYVTSRFGRNEKLMYATPMKVDPKFWDAQHQRVKQTRYCPYRDDVNDALNALEARLTEFVTSVVRDSGTLSKEKLRTFLDVHFGKLDKGVTFHAFFKDFIEKCSTRVNAGRGGQVVTYRTMREYANTLSMIEEYEKSRKVHVDFDDVTQDFLSDFVSYLQELNYATNTIFHKVKNVKAVMNAAMERGLTDNGRWKYFRKTSEQTEAVALSEEELQRLLECDFSSVPRLERVRDLFLLGCWTGLRFSDVTRIRKENIKEGVITIVQSKTNEPVVIPLHPVFIRIWDKYGGDIPVHISNQKFNDYIKEACRMAGINDKILKSITKGGRKVTTQYEKWQLVSSHTARRSFATNLYKSGFPSISIMQITGHRTESAFLKYIRVSKQEYADMLADHWKKMSDLNNK